jgi:23S rRNA (adenine2503-C2)-methyltransferase
MSFEELSEALGGAGRARIVWDCYKLGIDPAHMFGSVINLGQDDYESIVARLPSQRRTQKLGPETLDKLQKLYQNSYGGKNPSVTTVEGGVASLSYISRASDTTTKLLLKLSDGLEVETVIIPWNGKRSTLCISSQVGCRQGKPHKVSFFFCSNDDPSMKSHFWNIIILSLCISTCVIIIFNYWLQVALFVPPGEWEN